MESDDQFGLLQKAERRIILRELREESEATTFETLVTAIVARTADHDDRSARIRLHHVDLPKLKEAGILDYDSRTGDVVSCDAIDHLDEYLTVVDGEAPQAAV